MIEDILAENIIHRIAPCKHCPKTFIEIFTPYTFSEKASPFFVATKCNTSKLVAYKRLPFGGVISHLDVCFSKFIKGGFAPLTPHA